MKKFDGMELFGIAFIIIVVAFVCIALFSHSNSFNNYSGPCDNGSMGC